MTAIFYQVSFFEESIAKVQKDSKKRVTWVFRVIDNGHDREHSVTSTWSLKSGKQEVEMDGAEQVVSGKRRGASVYDSRWESNTQVPMKLQILATSAPPLSDGFRCFDLIVNGQAFAHMPQYNGAEGLPAPPLEPSLDGKPKSVPSAEQRQPEQPYVHQQQHDDTEKMFPGDGVCHLPLHSGAKEESSSSVRQLDAVLDSVSMSLEAKIPYRTQRRKSCSTNAHNRTRIRERQRQSGSSPLANFRPSLCHFLLGAWARIFVLLSPSVTIHTTAFVPILQSLSPERLRPFSIRQTDITLAAVTSIPSQGGNSNFDGLSKAFQSILSRTNNDRQRFVTGKYPVIITVEDNPTLRWLKLGKDSRDISTAVVMVNGTSIDRSVASYDRYQWLDEHERQELHNQYATVSMELLAEIYLPRPGYLQILPGDGAGSSAALQRATESPNEWNKWRPDAASHEMRDLELQEAPFRERLWVTGFSLASRNGFIKSVDIQNGHIDTINKRSESMVPWPNEVNQVPADLVSIPKRSVKNKNSGAESQFNKLSEITRDALLVSDGFLVPGKDRGGIYVVNNPGNEKHEWSVCLTDLFEKERWFYHRAVWVDLTGDGRKSVLTARAKLQKVTTSSGEQLSETSSDLSGQLDGSRPKNGQLVWLEMPKPDRFDEATGTPLEKDGTPFDPFSARHLPWKETVLATGPDVMFAVADMDANDNTIEILASEFFDKKVSLHSIEKGPVPKVVFSRDIDTQCGAAFGGILANLHPSGDNDRSIVIDSGSTVNTLIPGDCFSHFLVTSHECDYEKEVGTTSTSKAGSLRGGSLFAYRIPPGKDAWKSETWQRTTVASGFEVQSQIWNVINPGAPGFCYTFHAHRDDKSKAKRPMIAVAGDCAESAFVFRPEMTTSTSTTPRAIDPNAQYELMCEIKCGATVGSIAVGYGDLCAAEQEPGYAKMYVPCFEKDKILVFALGSGESETSVGGW